MSSEGVVGAANTGDIVEEEVVGHRHPLDITKNPPKQNHNKTVQEKMTLRYRQCKDGISAEQNTGSISVKLVPGCKFELSRTK